MKNARLHILKAVFVLGAVSLVYSKNPIITGIYTADPSGHVFNGTMYLYPSHDRSDATWFDMTDWHVFSSKNLVDWTDHGVATSSSPTGPFTAYGTPLVKGYPQGFDPCCFIRANQI